MDHILESVQFEEFFKALKATMVLSAAQKASWKNPSAAMLVASVNLSIWHVEHPEEARAHRETAVAAANEWREKHPGKARANREKGWAVIAEWLEEDREGFIAMSMAWMKEDPGKAQAGRVMGAAAAKRWKEKHPEETRAQLARIQPIATKAAAKAKAQKYAQNYFEWLRTIKPFIPTTGIRLRELQKLAPQWTEYQLETLLPRAVKYGDLIRIGKYYLPGKESL